MESVSGVKVAKRELLVYKSFKIEKLVINKILGQSFSL